MQHALPFTGPGPFAAARLQRCQRVLTDEKPVRPAAEAGFDAAALGLHTDAMRRFARRRIRDAALAEDAVQDALLAALTALDSFRGQSSLRTWLFGILAHKIQDAFRREGRYVREPVARAGAGAGDGGRDGGAGGGVSGGPWGEPVATISDDPVARLASRRMLECLVNEVDALPPSLREVFVRQAIEEEPTDQVCAALAISEANCWVRLHRARKRLTAALVEHR